MWREGVMLALGFAIAGGGFGRRRETTDAPHEAAPPRTDETSTDLRDRFLGTISHELRTPLNAVIGWAQMLKGGQLTPSQVTHAIAAIDRNARREAQLIEDLLDVSRMQSGRLRVRREPLDLTVVVNDVLSASRPAADTAGVTLRTSTPGDPLRVLGDAARLHQVVDHAVGNAIKFTPRGGNVHVQLARSGPYAELRVRDDGVGIARRYLARVFEPFFQAPSSVRRSGLGLGLTLVQELVGAHHGSVTLDSQGHAGGSVLTIRLPLTRALPRQQLRAAGAARMQSAPAFG